MIVIFLIKKNQVKVSKLVFEAWQASLYSSKGQVSIYIYIRYISVVQNKAKVLPQHKCFNTTISTRHTQKWWFKLNSVAWEGQTSEKVNLKYDKWVAITVCVKNTYYRYCKYSQSKRQESQCCQQTGVTTLIKLYWTLHYIA